MKNTKTQQNAEINMDNYFTAYIVRETNTGKFLNRRAYSGRLRGIWSAKADAQIFYSRSKASSCASNINHRRPDGPSSYYAQVTPVLLEKTTPTKKTPTAKTKTK